MRQVILLALLSVCHAGDVYEPYENNGTDTPLPQPFSKLVFINDLVDNQVFEFDKDVKVYVCASKDTGANDYESKIVFLITQEYASSISMTNATSRGPDEDGHKTPVFPTSVRSVTVVNNNNEKKANFKNPGFIYFVAEDEKHQSRVIEPSTDTWTIEAESENLNHNYITLLNPTGAVKINNIRNINGLTVFNVQAGGVAESDRQTRLFDVTSEQTENSSLVILEPIVTVRKLNTVTPSEFAFDVQAIDYKEDSIIHMKPNWSEVMLANSPNYGLLNTSTSQRFVIEALEEKTQFDIHVMGDLDASSSLTFSYDGYDGAGSESKTGAHGMDYSINIKGRHVIIDYKRGETDKTRGFLARIECYQSASSVLLYTTLIVTILNLF